MPTQEVLRLLEVVAQLRTHVEIRDRVSHLRLYSNCFLGSDAVTWLSSSPFCPTHSREEAVVLGRALLRAGFFHHIQDDHDFSDRPLFYRFYVDEDTLYKRFWRAGAIAPSVQGSRHQFAALRAPHPRPDLDIQVDALSVVRALNGVVARGSDSSEEDAVLTRLAGGHAAPASATALASLSALLLDLTQTWPQLVKAHSDAALTCPSNWRLQPHVALNSMLLDAHTVDALQGCAHALALCRTQLDALLHTIAACVREMAHPHLRGTTQHGSPGSGSSSGSSSMTAASRSVSMAATQSATVSSSTSRTTSSSHYRSPLLSFIPMMKRALGGARPSHDVKPPPSIPEAVEVTFPAHIPSTAPSPLIAHYQRVASSSSASTRSSDAPALPSAALLTSIAHLSSTRASHTLHTRHMATHMTAWRERVLRCVEEAVWAEEACHGHVTVWKRVSASPYPAYKARVQVDAPIATLLPFLLDHVLRGKWDPTHASGETVADVGFESHPHATTSSSSTSHSRSSSSLPEFTATGAPGRAPLLEDYFTRPPSLELQPGTRRGGPSSPQTSKRAGLLVGRAMSPTAAKRPRSRSEGGVEDGVQVAPDSNPIRRVHTSTVRVRYGRRVEVDAPPAAVVDLEPTVVAVASTPPPASSGRDEELLYETAARFFDRVLGGASSRQLASSLARMNSTSTAPPRFPRVLHTCVNMGSVSTLCAPRDAVLLQDLNVAPDGRAVLVEVSVQHTSVTTSTDATRCECLADVLLLEPAASGTRVTRVSQWNLNASLPPWLQGRVVDMMTRTPLEALRDLVQVKHAGVPRTAGLESSAAAARSVSVRSQFRFSDSDSEPEPVLEVSSSGSSRLTLHDFELLSTIGRGGYGKVLLVRRKGEVGRVYAMKILRKRDVIAKGNTVRVVNERRILSTLTSRHPFIVHLLYAFQTSSKAYMVMEYVPGGDFFTLLASHGPVPLHRATLYGAEAALALSALHESGVVYRDLKPENVLLDAEGHVKLTDFGLSRCPTDASQQHTSRLLEAYTVSRSFCGTEQYMAPEVLLQQGHCATADWWSLGIFMSEVLTGRHPFRGSTHLDTLRNIVNPHIAPATLSMMPPAAAAFVAALLCKDPARRLGSLQCGGFSAVQGHAFFRGIDWERVYARGYTPDWKPRVKSITDTSNFDAAFTREPAVDSSSTMLSAQASASLVEAAARHGGTAASFSQFSYRADSEQVPDTLPLTLTAPLPLITAPVASPKGINAPVAAGTSASTALASPRHGDDAASYVSEEYDYGEYEMMEGGAVEDDEGGGDEDADDDGGEEAVTPRAAPLYTAAAASAAPGQPIPAPWMPRPPQQQFLHSPPASFPSPLMHGTAAVTLSSSFRLAPSMMAMPPHAAGSAWVPSPMLGSTPASTLPTVVGMGDASGFAALTGMMYPPRTVSKA